MNFIRENIVKIGIALRILIVVIILAVALTPKKQPVDKSTGYIEMENKLQAAALKYASKNPGLYPRNLDEKKRIQMDTLISNNLLNEMHAIEDQSVVCSGYVEIIKKDKKKTEYRFTPYIKCGKYYQTKTIVNYIKDNEKIVTTGDGLYLDNDTYIYKGEYPHNYIMLDDKVFRILEIDKDGHMKVIANNGTNSNFTWDNRYNTEEEDNSGINDFQKSRLKENLYFIYSNNDQNLGEVYFNDLQRDYILKHDFCIGKRANGDYSLSNATECKVTTPLYVGLLSVSEYANRSISSGCTAINKLECTNYNYLSYLGNNGISTFVTLTANASNTYEFYLIESGNLLLESTDHNGNVYPVIYLQDYLIYKEGNGSSKHPYIIR